MKKIIFGTLLLIAGTAISQTAQKKIANDTLLHMQADTTIAPQSPVKPKTLSLDASNPNYRKEQKKYTGPDRDFSRERSKKKTRKDTSVIK